MIKKREEGITLVALIITIIVLLILAGVTIAMISNNDNAIQKAAEANQKEVLAETKDELSIKAQEALINYYNTVYTGENTESTKSIQEAVAEEVSEDLASLKNTKKELLNTSEVKADYTITLKTELCTETGSINEKGMLIWDDHNI